MQFTLTSSWYDQRTDTWYEWENPELFVYISPNEVVHELLDAKGKVIRRWLERRPPGFR